MPETAVATPVAATSGANFSVGEHQHSAVKWFIGCALIIAVVTVLSLIWYLLLGGNIATKQTERATLESQLATKEYTQLAERIITVKASQDGLEKAIKDQAPTLQLFSDIESRLTKDVKLLTASLTEKGEVKLEGELPTMTALAKTMLSLKSNPAFSTFRLSGLGAADSSSPRTRFSLTFSVDMKQFSKQTTEKAAPAPVAPAAAPAKTPAPKSSLLPQVVERSVKAKER